MIDVLLIMVQTVQDLLPQGIDLEKVLGGATGVSNLVWFIIWRRTVSAHNKEIKEYDKRIERRDKSIATGEERQRALQYELDLCRARG